MATTQRVTGGINNLDTAYMQTVINNVRNRIQTTGVVRAQDIQDLIWLYNTLAGHSHSYYDYEFEKYGNVNQSVFVPQPVQVKFSYEAPEYYVRQSDRLSSFLGGSHYWYWNGALLGTTSRYTQTLGGYSKGALRKTVTNTLTDSEGYTTTATYNHYEIIYSGYYVTYSSSVGSSKSTYGVTGASLFQFSSELAAGKVTTTTYLNTLANLINSLRSHTHQFNDVTV